MLSMPSAARRAARRRGTGCGVNAGFSRQPPAPGGAGQPVGAADPPAGEGAGCVRQGVPLSVPAAAGACLRCRTPSLLRSGGHLFFDAVVLGQYDW